jgi:predicted phosphodiesterase
LEERSLTFVHLSDIHFSKDLSEVSKYDLDSGLRHAILRDLKHLRPQFAEFDGILVSGDVAYAGKLEEYQTAIKWLDEIAEVIGCDPGQVWCVPGNHDIDQSVQKTYTYIVDTHAALRVAPDLADALRERLDNSTNGPLLFQPLQTYHEQFGVKYGCPTTCKEPYWEDTLLLNDGSRLRIRGINSAYCSSRNDDEKKAPLIVGPMQTVFKPEDDVAYLTLCHHPPDWLLDGKDLAEALNADSHVQLFGHKHFHQHQHIGNSVVLSSGAVHPVRSEQQWEPRYYILSLLVKGSDATRELEVALYPRVWDKASREFLADRGCDGHGAQIETLKLTPWSKPVLEVSEPPAREETPPVVANRKRLLHQFMLLPYVKQVSIVRGLNLFSEEEMNKLPDTELFIETFQRAKQTNNLDPLWNAIEAEAKS